MAYPAVSIVAVTVTPSPLALPTPADAEEWLDGRARGDLDRARELVAAIKADRPIDAADLLNRWNDVSIAIGNVASVASLFSEVHPEEAVRSLGEAAMQEVQRLAPTEPGPRALRGVRRRSDALTISTRPPRRLLEQDAARLPARRRRPRRRHPRPASELSERASVRRAGVRQEHPRRRPLGQGHARAARRAAAGLDRRPRRRRGRPRRRSPPTTPTYVPFMTYARDRDARRAAADGRSSTAPGRPTTRCSRELFELRREHAQLLGYADWADYDAEVKMIEHGDGDPGVHRPDRRAAAEPPAERDVAGRCSTGCGRTTPTPTTIDRRRPRVLRRGGAAGAARRRRPGGAHVLRLHQGATRAARGHRAAVRADVPRPRSDAVLWHEDVAAYDVFLRRRRPARSAGSTSTCTRARASTSTRPSSTCVRGVARPPAAGGRARLQLPARPDGARPTS